MAALECTIYSALVFERGSTFIECIVSIVAQVSTNCNSCHLRGICYKAKKHDNRGISHFKKTQTGLKENLLSELNIYHRKKQPGDDEPVFENLKNNHHFNHFLIRGKQKVE